jgi:hypothetical protein
MPSSHDPATPTPEERLRELARILATGLLRLRSPVISPEQAPTSATQKSEQSTPNHLAVAGHTSVTVHAG